MKKIKIIITCVCLIILTGCGCQKQTDNKESGVKETKLTSISIATGDIGFQSINIDGEGNENDVITLDSEANILVTTYPDLSSEKYEFVFSNEGVIEIDDNFNIKPLKVGKTIVTAKSTDGSDIESNKITIEVVENTENE